MSPRILKRSLLIALLSLLFAAPLNAAQLTPLPRAEIEVLLSALEASGCRFNRNGSWHTAEEARMHLLRKLDYLEGKNAVQNTERFIDLAASASSVSGKEYLVQCGDTPPITSKQWLLAQLATIRSSAAVR